MNSTQNFKLQIPIKSISNVCRVCLNEQKLLIPIHQINFTHNFNSNGSLAIVTINEVILKYCNVVVHMHDKKPQKLCQSCMKTMCEAYNFFELFLRSNATLEKLLTKHEAEERENLKNNPKSKDPTTNPLDILPVSMAPSMEQLVFNSSANPANLNQSCPVAFVDTLNAVNMDVEKDQIVLSANTFSVNDSVPTKDDKSGQETLNSVDGMAGEEDKEVALINRNCLKSYDIREGKKLPRPQRRIKTPPFFIDDPEGSLLDHTYIISEERFMLMKERRLRRRIPRKPKVVKPIKAKPVKQQPIKLSRHEAREQKRKFERENDIFHCRFCRKTYQPISKVLEHLNDEHPLNRRCILCPKIVKRTQNMMFHVASHSKYGLVCRICRLCFENKESLELHNAEFDHSNALNCPICGKTFCRLRTRRAHMAEVHGDKEKIRTQCSQCGLVLRKCNLPRHERTHEELEIRKKFLCQTCGKWFTSKYALELHVKVFHEGQRHLANKFKYPKSKKEYAANADDQENKAKIYACQLCPRTFNNEKGMFKHNISHPEYKSVQCPYCTEVLDNGESYRKHRALAHSSFICRICNKGFPNKILMTVHEKTHTKRHKCVVCNMDFGTLAYLKVHRLIHTGEKPFRCQHCHKAFKQNSQLSQHIMCLHTEKIKKCNVCGKTFNFQYSLNAHIRTHTGEKPFGCPYCNKHFRDTVSRHKHVKRDHPDKIEEFLEYKRTFQQVETRKILYGNNPKVDAS